MSVTKDITNNILNDKPLLKWSHSENNYYKRLGENVAGRISDFASISSEGGVLKVKPKKRTLTAIFNFCSSCVY